MKEQLFEILHNRKRMPGERFSDIEGRVEELVNQEVEKRIKERMPSEEEITATAYNIMINYLTNGNPDRDFVKSTIGADDNKQWWANGVRWLRSRLSPQDTPQDTPQVQKEGGEG